ncbi:MAG: Uncharacterized aldehyde oxidase, molybdopterin-binding subunit [uncultured Paraburkholderia sp.]|nr:MAG: Uncharacterized aldehyde oxidase, molybdopterin-binding subunit [uncultured Paraburkholderia sp.]CAH2940851.1 MAG: Uncharacterized aldehyde oxidase, molybdopterin-binding subunit [uncultured Paraburkholderia sp.]
MLKRRTFLLGGADAVGALLVGWSVMPPGQQLTTSTPLPLAEGQVALNGWVKIAADNSVTIMMCKAEMGQGVHTGFAMLLADKLDADWSRVRVESSPVDRIYNSAQSIVDDPSFRPDDEGTMKRTAVWFTRKLMREGGTVATFDASVAQSMPGFIKAFAVAPYNGGTGGVAVIASNAFRAMNTVNAIKVEWNHGDAAQLSSAHVIDQLCLALNDRDGHAYYRQGDVDAALNRAARTVSAEYHAPYLAHGAVEPVNCTVQFDDGAATVWAATQVPALTRHHVAKVLNIDADKVDLQQQLLGGAFGRRLELDFISQAAMIACEGSGRPMQTIWSRAQDFTHDFIGRPACRT